MMLTLSVSLWQRLASGCRLPPHTTHPPPPPHPAHPLCFPPAGSTSRRAPPLPPSCRAFTRSSPAPGWRASAARSCRRSSAAATSAWTWQTCAATWSTRVSQSRGGAGGGGEGVHGGEVGRWVGAGLPSGGRAAGYRGTEEHGGMRSAAGAARPRPPLPCLAGIIAGLLPAMLAGIIAGSSCCQGPPATPEAGAGAGRGSCVRGVVGCFWPCRPRLSCVTHTATKRPVVGLGPRGLGPRCSLKKPCPAAAQACDARPS